MNRKLFTLFIITSGLFFSCTKTDNEILTKTISKLNSIKTVEFQTVTRNNQKEMGLDKIDTAICYFDFTGNDSLIGAKYQILFNQGLQVYNETQAFFLDKNKERIIYTNEPQLYDASNSIFMMNSVWTIKKLLPGFIKDSTVSIKRLNDTIVNGESNYVFNIAIKDRYINIGAILTESKGTTFNLELFVSKKTYFPTELKTVFPDIKESTL